MFKVKFTISEIIFIILSIFACIYSIYGTPIAGVADQGDFERVMRQAGLDYIDIENHNFYSFVEPLYKMEWTNPLFLIGIVPSTSFIYPIFISKIICRLMFLNYFDTKVLAAIMCIIYTISCFIIFRHIKIKNQIIKSILAATFVFVFFDGVNLTIFNSMYGQAIMLVSIAMFIASCAIVIDNWNSIKKWNLIFLFVSSIFLLGSKLQCFVLLPFIIAVFLFVRKNTEYKKLVLILLCITIWYSVGNYVFRGRQLNNDTQYNSVFYGILKDSNNPMQDLIDLGLNPDMAVDAGKHAYLSVEEYAYPPRTDIMKTEFYDKMSNVKLMKFYLMHPTRIINAMEITAKNSFHNYIDLGTFEKTAGYPQGTSKYRFDAWSEIRDNLPKTLLFIIPMYLLFFAVAIYQYRKNKSKYALLYIIILLMGLIQFPMPYIGNGNADITKQLFLFNISFDIGVFGLAWHFTRLLVKERTEKHNGQKRKNFKIYK